VAELGNEGLNFLEQLGAIAQANDQHMCAAQSQREVAQGCNSFQTDTCGIQLGAICGVDWTERVQPHGMNYVDRRSIHFEYSPK
jgi:hypothetical protein